MKQLAAISLLLLCPLTAQIADAAAGASGVTTHEGVPFGLGPGYSARFEAPGVAFTPALGSLVESPMPWRFTLTSVSRGAAILWHGPQAHTPEVRGDSVRYRRSSGLLEVYDVRPDGIEQSFVFASRPAGEGDLVVRGTIVTELPLASARDDGVRFELPGKGGVAIGAVTGIDANGARMPGSLRCDGTTLELVLPAAFVDAAAYPLVLDPMIGTSFLVANIAGGSDVQPSLAFDETTQRYLVVWSVPMSATSAEVRAAFVTANGPIGTPLLLDGSAVAGVRAVVANINQHDRFVVVWASNPVAISAVAIAATTAAVSGATAINGQGFVLGLALGGDSRIPFSGVAENALLVHTSRSTTVSAFQSAHRVLLQVPATGAPILTSTLNLYFNVASEFGPPAVTKHAGSSGRWMYTLAHRLATGVVVYDAVMVRTNGASCDGLSWLGGSTTPFDLRTAAATTNGSEFLVAYETNDQNFSLRRMHYSGTLACGSGALTSDPAFSPVVPNSGHQYPELDCARDKYVLAWRQPSSSNVAQIRVLGVGLQAGQGNSFLAQFSTLAQIDPAVAARYSGGDGSSDEALVAWASSGIRARPWQATGSGTVTSLGGACGIPGLSDVNTYTGTPVLGTTFSISVLAPTAPVLALIVGFSQGSFACGPCTIVPSLDVLLAGGGPVPVNVPLDANLVGFDLYAQWLQWRPSGCALLPDFGFTNTLKFTVAE